jgi:hypothetical protein
MVTKDRPEMAIASISAFLRQDYARKQLVVVSESGPEAREMLSRHIGSLRSPLIALVHVQPGRYALGGLRNLSLKEARGELVCQWDDDDLHHARRISVQAAHLLARQAGACFLSDQLQLHRATASLYWCDWAAPRSAPRWPPAIPNTLMCWREAAGQYPEVGPNSRRSEDLVFMKGLFRRYPVAVLAGHAPLYIYVAHGANTWDDAHHRRIERITGLEAAELRLRRPELEPRLREHRLPSPLTVRGHDGDVAFEFIATGDEPACQGVPCV